MTDKIYHIFSPCICWIISTRLPPWMCFCGEDTVTGFLMLIHPSMPSVKHFQFAVCPLPGCSDFFSGKFSSMSVSELARDFAFWCRLPVFCIQSCKASLASWKDLERLPSFSPSGIVLSREDYLPLKVWQKVGHLAWRCLVAADRQRCEKTLQLQPSYRVRRVQIANLFVA